MILSTENLMGDLAPSEQLCGDSRLGDLVSGVPELPLPAAGVLPELPAECAELVGDGK